MSLVKIEGLMGSDAQARVNAAGDSFLILKVGLPEGRTGNAVQIEATKAYGRGAAAQMVCSSMAHRLRRGARVQMQGTTLTVRRGRAELEGVHTVDAPDFTPAYLPYKD